MGGEDASAGDPVRRRRPGRSSTSRRGCWFTAGGPTTTTWRCFASATCWARTSTRCTASIAAPAARSVFARTREAAAILCESFESRQVDKRYLALVRGEPAASGTIDHPISEERRKGAGAPRVPAVTRYRAGRPVDRRPLLAGAGDPRDGARPSGAAAPAPPRASAGGRRQLRPRRDQPPLPRRVRPAPAGAARPRHRLRAPGHAARPWRSPRPCRTIWPFRSSGWPCHVACRAKKVLKAPRKVRPDTARRSRRRSRPRPAGRTPPRAPCAW